MALILGLNLAVPGAYAASKVTVPTNLRIFYYRDSTTSRDSLIKNAKYIDVLAPQSYAFNWEGKLEGSIPPDVITFAKKNKIKLMPLVTNGSFDQASLAKVLDDTSVQKKAIQMLVDEAEKYGYWGWQINFEQVDIAYKDKLTAFTKKFAAAMKKEKLVSSIAVIAQISETPSDYPRDLWQRVIGAYDYKELGKSVNFLSIMSYDDPGSLGPIARYDWFKKVIEYSKARVPAEKLSMGIALYFWKRDVARGVVTQIGGYSTTVDTMKYNKVTTVFSKEERAPFYTYYSNIEAKNFMVWYENNVSLKAKFDLMRTYGIRSFSAWALGQEDPSVFQAMEKM